MIRNELNRAAGHPSALSTNALRGGGAWVPLSVDSDEGLTDWGGWNIESSFIFGSSAAPLPNVFVGISYMLHSWRRTKHGVLIGLLKLRLSILLWFSKD